LGIANSLNFRRRPRRNPFQDSRHSNFAIRIREAGASSTLVGSADAPRSGTGPDAGAVVGPSIEAKSAGIGRALTGVARR
jgi:hypothetical protein